MRIIGVIPSRWGSTRFPGKSLELISGKPLVRWVAEACKRAKRLDEVLVATDDVRIAKALEGTGVRAVMTPSDLPSGTDRVAVAAQAGPDDLVINIQGDEPLINPELIDAIAEKLLTDSSCEMATACAPIRTMEELAARTIVQVVMDRYDRALYFSRLPIPCRRDGEQDLKSGLYQRHIGIYGYRGAFLAKMVAEKPCDLEKCEGLEQLRALWMGARIGVVRTNEVGIGVDRPEDIAVIEEIIKQRS